MTTKIQVHFYTWPDFSNRPHLNIEPINYNADAQKLTDDIVRILEEDLNGKRTKVIEGLEQTFIDYDINGVALTLEQSWWDFLSILTLDEKLRANIERRIRAEFEIIPRPPQDGDDE